ncbi:hypothetical protein MRX96_048047 [Rhipicephalus microplus]
MPGGRCLCWPLFRQSCDRPRRRDKSTEETPTNRVPSQRTFPDVSSPEDDNDVARAQMNYWCFVASAQGVF